MGKLDNIGSHILKKGASKIESVGKLRILKSVKERRKLVSAKRFSIF